MTPASSSPKPIQRVVVDPQLALDPARAAGHVLHDQRDRHASARRRSRRPAGCGRAAAGRRRAAPITGNSRRVITAGISRVLGAGFAPAAPSAGRGARWPDALARRAEVAAARRRSGDHAQHGDLAQGIEAAEVDQDHVDDVGAAAVRVGLLQEVARMVSGEVASSPRRSSGGDARPAATARCARSRRRRSRDGSRARRPAGSAWAASAAEQQEDRGDHLDQQLRQGEVGAENQTKVSRPRARRRRARSAPAAGGTSPARPRPARRRPDSPDQREARDRRRPGAAPRLQPALGDRPSEARSAAATQPQLRLQPPRAEQPSSARASRQRGDQQASKMRGLRCGAAGRRVGAARSRCRSSE